VKRSVQHLLLADWSGPRASMSALASASEMRIFPAISATNLAASEVASPIAVT
jgi:precorrin-6B methylase 1